MTRMVRAPRDDRNRRKKRYMKIVRGDVVYRPVKKNFESNSIRLKMLAMKEFN